MLAPHAAPQGARIHSTHAYTHMVVTLERFSGVLVSELAVCDFLTGATATFESGAFDLMPFDDTLVFAAVVTAVVVVALREVVGGAAEPEDDVRCFDVAPWPVGRWNPTMPCRLSSESEDASIKKRATKRSRYQVKLFKLKYNSLIYFTTNVYPWSGIHSGSNGMI